MLVDIYKLNSALIEESLDPDEIGSYDIFSEFYEGSFEINEKLTGLRSLLNWLGYIIPKHILTESPGESFVMIYDAITRQPIFRLQIKQ